MTSNNIIEEFPKKKKLKRIQTPEGIFYANPEIYGHEGDPNPLENKICPSANQCTDKTCPERKPHIENEICKKTCLLEPGSRYVGQCIQIPNAGGIR